MPYFAYANLLDIDRIRSVAPSARPMGVMTLPGYRLAFAFCQGRGHGGVRRCRKTRRPCCMASTSR
jgi:hypothetical protein